MNVHVQRIRYNIPCFSIEEFKRVFPLLVEAGYVYGDHRDRTVHQVLSKYDYNTDTFTNTTYFVINVDYHCSSITILQYYWTHDIIDNIITIEDFLKLKN